MKPEAWLIFGPPGVGKTMFCVSSFWDNDTRSAIRTGMWLQVGRESNNSLLVPPEYTRRLVSPSQKPMQFSQELRGFLKEARAERKKGNGYDVVVIDGLSEWGVLVEAATREEVGPSDKWGVWRKYKEMFIELVQLMEPEELGAWVLCTSRLKLPSEGDPEWMRSRYVPAMDGWARDNVGYYFSAVLYMDVDEKNVKGVITPKYLLWMLPRKGYWIKNVWGKKWMDKGYDNPVESPTFDKIITLLEA